MLNSRGLFGLRYYRVLPVALLCFLVACSGGEKRRPSEEVALRLLPDAPDSRLRFEDLCQRVLKDELSLNQEEWELNNLKRVGVQGRGMLLEATASSASLTTTVRIEAENVDALEIGGQGFVGRASLLWSKKGQDFSERRRIQIDIPPGQREFLFQMGGDPGWAGRIEKIRLVPVLRPAQKIRIVRLRLLKFKKRPLVLRESVNRTWQLSLGEISMPGRPGPVGVPFSWQFEARRGDVLEFSFGLEGGVRSKTSFRIRKRGSGGLQTIWEESIDPNHQGSEEWHDRSILLGVVGPEQLELQFETSSPDGMTRGPGFPLWGAPRIIRRTSEEAIDAPPPNVVLISVDTLRADHLSSYGYERRTSPEIDRWAADEGVLFENTVAAAPWTLPSHYSMFSGLDALRHGINHGPPMVRPPELMAEFFSKRGFETIAWTGGAFLHPRYGLNRGFDRYFAPYSHSTHPEELENNTRALIEWIESHPGRRFFALLHTYEVHAPYRPRQPWLAAWRRDADNLLERSFFTQQVEASKRGGYEVRSRLCLRDGAGPLQGCEEEEFQQAVDFYDAGISKADAEIGSFLEFLRNRGYLKNTIVVFTSDHGEALGEQGLWGHGYLADFSVMVPLIISAPNLRHAGLKRSEQVASVDIMPTVIDLAGFKIPEGLDGRSLEPMMRGKGVGKSMPVWIYSTKTNFGLALRLSNREKYTLNTSAWDPVHGNEAFFRLDRDPGETTNSIGTAAESGALRRKAEKYFRKYARGILVDLRNPSDREVQGVLSFPKMQTLIINKVEGLGVPERGVEIINSRLLRFRIPPGDTFMLLCEDFSADSLHVGREGADTGSASGVKIDLRAGGCAFQEDGRWESGNPQPDGRLGSVCASRRNLDEEEMREASLPDAAILDQLHALGYME